jgi:hypothetical protein
MLGLRLNMGPEMILKKCHSISAIGALSLLEVSLSQMVSQAHCILLPFGLYL